MLYIVNIAKEGWINYFQGESRIAPLTFTSR